MRPHPILAATAAALLCAALTSCTRQEEEPRDAVESPAGAAVEPQAEEADESSPPPSDEPAQETPFGTPVGWAGEPLDRDGEEHPGVVGGAAGETVTASDAEELADHLSDEEPLTIEVSGSIDLDGAMEVGSDKTLVGVEEGVELTGGRLVVDGSSNVILANLGLEADGTAVAVRGGAHHVWVDGCTLTGGDDDAALVSVAGGADHVTLSWNHFRDAESAISIGGEDEEPDTLRVTVHHNYFDGTSGRHPSARSAAHVHVFNNYYRSNPEYGVRSTHDANVLVEGNFFDGTPVSVAPEDEEPGNVVTRDNLLVDSAQPDLRGAVPDPPYAYELDDTSTVPDVVAAGAGADSP
ncbi:right-handed parallel beta-helix repeat-containing protein [Nocardiopsis sp. CT-R113]|uniref:Right-handed parallel beta-helix repeat-containing protein n=1 Tax=Nocardiopsis codii TaxID=3065942 RepID=A0ABU7K1A7_9ACTN|nr:right-handed parallel beta-helix repeat-containing protein [Nocardiopsis sp. CT-R113]MEE2035842.1 right-handed parallel beta-helix repeat-containing protein [Nocardiopsis sp. CT-R113]